MQRSSAWAADAPLVIAHRGASAYAPENTLPAFILAAELGADAIELDAKLTADGHVVVVHDGTLDRTTDGQGLVHRHSLSELRLLDAGSHFGGAFKGVRIPTLAETLDAVGERLLVNVEMANYPSPWDDLPCAVVDLARAFSLERRMLLSSFNPVALRKAHRQAAEIPLGLLLGPGQRGALRLLTRLFCPYDALHIHDSLISETDVAREHRARRRVHVWTVNQASRFSMLICMGADGIITDVPDLARKALSDVRPAS